MISPPAPHTDLFFCETPLKKAIEKPSEYRRLQSLKGTSGVEEECCLKRPNTLMKIEWMDGYKFSKIALFLSIQIYQQVCAATKTKGFFPFTHDCIQSIKFFPFQQNFKFSIVARRSHTDFMKLQWIKIWSVFSISHLHK